MGGESIEDAIGRTAAKITNVEQSKSPPPPAAPSRMPFSPPAASPPSTNDEQLSGSPRQSGDATHAPSPSSFSLPPRNPSNDVDNSERGLPLPPHATSPKSKSFINRLELENQKRKSISISREKEFGEIQDDPNSIGDTEGTYAPEPEKSGSESNGEDSENEVIRAPTGQPELAEMWAKARQVDQLTAAAFKQLEPPKLGSDNIVEPESELGDKTNDLVENIEAEAGVEVEAEVEQANTSMYANKQVEPAIDGPEKDFAESASEVGDGLAEKLEAEIDANSPIDSQMTCQNKESIRADESNSNRTIKEETKGGDGISSGMAIHIHSQTDLKQMPMNTNENNNNHTTKEDIRGKDDFFPGGGHASEAIGPQAVTGRNELSPLPKDQIEEDVVQTNRKPLLDREILFDDSVINIPAFDDGSEEARQKVQGWTYSKWIAASEKVLRFTTPVLRVMPGRFFWSSDVFKKRIMAIYDLGLGDVILILRLPTDKDEVRRLAHIQGSLELSEQELHSFLVVESAADPKTCKIQLSQLTHSTSVPSKGQNNPSKKNMPRRRSCFNILTPTEVVTLSAAFLPDDSFEDIQYTCEKSLNDTLRCEDALVSALVHSYSLSNSKNCATQQAAWKHTVVLGSLHSYVITGHDKALKDSLENALQIQNFQSNYGNESDDNYQMRIGAETGILDCKVIDARDDSGKTALHYACSRRRSSTVQILVNAGADCSVSQTIDELTPCHICAKGLDEKGLSIVLSASHPTRPNPNALDCHGRTPMYLAAVEGMSNEFNGNAIALDLCLSALKAWGGQLILGKPECKELLHPVHCVSAQWKAEELSVVLSHCNYHYPLRSIDGSDPGGISLSAIFHYPIHAALVSLRKRIASAFAKNADNEFNAEFMPKEPALVKTIRTLLEHGFEPNERIEGIVGQGEDIKTFSSYFGTNPLQILALAAAEAKAIDLKKRHLGEEDVESMRILKNIMRVIRESAELLVTNGARLKVQPPPPTRLDRGTPTGCYSLQEAIKDQKPSSMPIGYREGLKLDGNDEILALLGGASRVSTCQNAFAVLGQTVKVAGTLTVGTSPLNSDAPGGSDSYSCAVCWSEFGIISNRKHLCRVSLRYVCNDCSTRRLVKNAEHRISDGQFLLARAEAKKMNEKLQTEREERVLKQRQSVTQSRKSLGLKSTIGSVSSIDTEVEQTKLSRKEKITNAISGLSQTRNAVLERGDKLESLADKTEALNEASLDFAKMAKELNRNQNSWW